MICDDLFITIDSVFQTPFRLYTFQQVTCFSQGELHLYIIDVVLEYSTDMSSTFTAAKVF